jgi:MATE family multidrug resistance protein
MTIMAARPVQSPWRAEIGAMVTLALPLIATQLAQIAILTTDVLLMGWLGPDALAAGALGTNIFFVLWVMGIGLGMAVAPLIAQAIGRKRHMLRDARRTLRQGFWVTLAVTGPGTLVLCNAEPVLIALGQDPAIAVMSQDYTRALAAGLVPAAWFIVLRMFIAAFQRPRSALVVQLIVFALNASLAYVLMFGNAGFPALGLVGAGIASAVAHWASVILLLGFILIDRRFRRMHVLGRFWRPDWPRFRELWRVGLPVSTTMLFEVGLFSGAVYTMGVIGTAELAAHQIALQCASVTFMIPLGLSQAATVRVGQHAGAGNAAGVGRAGWCALALAVGFMAAMAVALWSLRWGLMDVFLDLNKPGAMHVAELGAGFLVVAGFFQIFDGAQSVALGALRGLKDTRVPMIATAFGYWGVGFPVTLICAFALKLGGVGVWYGLALGLFVVAVFATWRFRARERLGLVPGSA